MLNTVPVFEMLISVNGTVDSRQCFFLGGGISAIRDKVGGLGNQGLTHEKRSEADSLN